MRSAIAIAAFALALGGCSLTLPVRGQFQDGSETFSGSATGYTDGGGTLTLASPRGLQCTGAFVYVTPRTGEGTFNCSNGQSGPFSFVSTGSRGTGSGTLGGKTFTFTFG